MAALIWGLCDDDVVIDLSSYHSAAFGRSPNQLTPSLAPSPQTSLIVESHDERHRSIAARPDLARRLAISEKRRGKSIQQVLGSRTTNRVPPVLRTAFLCGIRRSSLHVLDYRFAFLLGRFGCQCLHNSKGLYKLLWYAVPLLQILGLVVGGPNLALPVFPNQHLQR